MAIDFSRGRRRIAGGVAPATLIGALALWVLAPDRTFAQAGAAEHAGVTEGEPDAPSAGRVTEVERELASGDAARVSHALGRMRAEAHPAYASVLRTLLERGGSEPVLSAALELARHYEKPELSAAVASYMQHRGAGVRQSAARALARTGGPPAVTALRLGLRSFDPVLREESARGLGELSDAGAVPDLFVALDRGITAAAESIGRLCDDATCIKLADRLGAVPFEAMSEALAAVVLRTDATVSSQTRVELIARLANLRTPQAAALLRGVRARWPEKGDRAVRDALDSALDTFGGAAR